MHGIANPQNPSLFSFHITFANLTPKFVSVFKEHGFGFGLTLN